MLALLLPFLGPFFDKIVGLIPDPVAAAKAKAEMLQAMIEATSKADAAQMAINQTEAASSSLFVAGWRPAVGWICVLALAFQYLVRPLILGVAVVFHHPEFTIPGLDDNLWQLTTGLLGMGALRTLEKSNGTATGGIGK